jgi:hypothetical protein
MYEAAGYPPPLPQAWTVNLPRGLSYLYLGKTGFFSSTGSRYAVLHDPFQLLAGARWLETGGEAQNAFGGQQTAWLQGTLTQSRATWTVLGNSVMMTPLVVDFTNPAIAAQLPPTFPDLLKTRLDLNLDQFDGFPQKRLELQTILGLVPNAVVISGDIHATFVTDHGDGGSDGCPPRRNSGGQRLHELLRRSRDPRLDLLRDRVRGVERRDRAAAVVAGECRPAAWENGVGGRHEYLAVSRTRVYGLLRRNIDDPDAG